MLIEHRPSHFN
jgi:hypothetical protein